MGSGSRRWTSITTGSSASATSRMGSASSRCVRVREKLACGSEEMRGLARRGGVRRVLTQGGRGQTERHIHLSEEDFNIITYDKKWCNRKGLLGVDEFERVMRDQLKLYVQRQMARSMVAARCAGSQVPSPFPLCDAASGTDACRASRLQTSCSC